MFGTADHPLTLEFRRFGPGDGFQLAIDGADLSSLVSRKRVTVEYGDLYVDKDSSFQDGTSKRDGQDSVPAIFLSSALFQTPNTGPIVVPSRNDVTPVMEAAVTQVRLVWGRNRVVINTGSLGKPFAAMRSCTDALLKAWGLDPAVQNTLTRWAQPVNLPAMVHSIQAVYPGSMASQGKQGRVNFRAIVNAQGVVTRCDTLRSYNDPAFDKLACNVVRRTKFEPALDKDGKPADSFYNQTVVYSIG